MVAPPMGWAVGGGGRTVAPARSCPQLSSRGYHVCARLASAEVACWGKNSIGQLGLERVWQREGPHVVEGLGGGGE